MTIQDLRTLLDYHYWARDRMLDALDPLTPEQIDRDLGSSFKSIRETVAHLYAAEWAWYERWQGQSPTALLSPDLFPDIAAIRRQWTAHRRQDARVPRRPRRRRHRASDRLHVAERRRRLVARLRKCCSTSSITPAIIAGK